MSKSVKLVEFLKGRDLFQMPVKNDQWVIAEINEKQAAIAISPKFFCRDEMVEWTQSVYRIFGDNDPSDQVKIV